MGTKETLVGKTCTIEHSRKGRFTMRITAADGEWISGVVEDGRTAAMLAENVCEAGDPITIRRSMIRRIEVIE